MLVSVNEYLLFNSKYNDVLVSINLNLNNISLSKSAKNRGIIVQFDMSKNKHISSVAKTFFLQLREFCHVRSFIPNSAAIILLHLQMHLYIPALIIVIAL